ncbi:MAG: hypothetical protein SWY16_20545 [Cyanobacteriota bacterium]|nr:hypothetical protein [Cyanobacteriota bacterium]
MGYLRPQGELFLVPFPILQDTDDNATTSQTQALGGIYANWRSTVGLSWKSIAPVYNQSSFGSRYTSIDFVKIRDIFVGSLNSLAFQLRHFLA